MEPFDVHAALRQLGDHLHLEFVIDHHAALRLAERAFERPRELSRAHVRHDRFHRNVVAAAVAVARASSPKRRQRRRRRLVASVAASLIAGLRLCENRARAHQPGGDEALGGIIRILDDKLMRGLDILGHLRDERTADARIVTASSNVR